MSTSKGSSSDADIKLLVGLEGGGSIDGESGRRIKRELESIASGLEGKGIPKIQVSIDDSSQAISKIQSQLNKISKNLTITIGVDTATGSSSSASGSNTTIDEVMRKRADSLRKSMDAISLSSYQPDLLKNYKDLDESVSNKNIKSARIEAQKLSAALATARKEQTRINSSNRIATDFKNLNLQVERYLSANKKIQSNPTIFGQVTDFSNRIKDVDKYGKGIQSARNEWAALQHRIREAGLETDTFTGKLTNLFKVHLGTQFIMVGVHQIIQQFRDIYTSVYEVNTAMTELKKVTNETDIAYTRFLDNASERAKNIGATLSDTVTATADFARLGYNIDDASEIADAALIYKNVGDGLEDINDASESIISTMKAFNIEADNAITIVDKFNITGNNFAISSGGVGEALKRSASSLSAAGNTLEESIGLIVAMNNVIQDPDVVGTSLKTISMRLRNTAGELEALDVDAEGAADSITKLQTQLLNLTGGKVNILEDNNTFKSTYDIITELSNVWNTLTDVQQAEITRLVAGTRQGNAFSALMTNMAEGAEATATALDSSGSALAENEVYLNSIQGKIDVFNASFEELSNTLLSAETVISGISFGTGFIQGLNGFAEFLNSISNGNSALLMISGIAGAMLSLNDAKILELLKTDKGFSFKFLGSDFVSMNQKLSDFDKSFDIDVSALEKYAEKIKSNKNIDFNTLKASEEFKSMSQSAKEAAMSMQINKKAVSENQVVIESFKTSQEQARSALKSTGIAAKASAVAISAANALLNAALTMGISLAITGLTTLVTSAISYKDTASQAADATRDKFETLKSELEEVNSEIESIRDKISEIDSQSMYITDEGVLSILQSENEELEKQLDLLVQIQAQKKADTRAAAIEALESETAESTRVDNRNMVGLQQLLDNPFGSDLWWSGLGNFALGNLENTTIGVLLGAPFWDKINYLTDPITAAEEQVDKIKELKAELNSLSPSMDNYEKRRDEISSELENASSSIAGFLDEYSVYKDSLDSVLDADIISRVESVSDSWKDLSSSEVLNELFPEDAYDDFIERLLSLESIGKIDLSGLLDIDPDENIIQQLKDKIADTTNQLTPSARSGLEAVITLLNDSDVSAELAANSFSDLSNEIGNLNEELEFLGSIYSEQIENGYISLDTLNKLMSSGEDWISLITVENGVIKANTEALKAKARANVDASIDVLTANKAILQSSVETAKAEMESAKSVIRTYAVVSAALTGGWDDYEQKLNNSYNSNESIKRLESQIASYESQISAIDGIISGLNNSKNNVFKDYISSSSSSASSSEDAWKKAFEQEKALLDHNLAMNYISQRGYYDQLDSLNKKYFANRSQYLDEYRKYEEEVYQGYIEQHRDDFEVEKALLDHNLAMNYISQAEYYEKLRQLNESYFANRKDYEDDYRQYEEEIYQGLLDLQKEYLNNQKELYESAHSAVINRYDEEIDKLEEQKEKLEETYNAQIDAIDKEIDALKEKNDEKQEEIDLEEKRQALYNAQTQKTSLVYREGEGFVWETDQSAIDKAKEELEQAELDKQISDLEDQKEKLEEALKEQSDAIDESIDKLEEYKEMWQDVTSSYQEAQDALHASQLIGADWEKQILEGRLDTLNNFKNKYNEILKQIDDMEVDSGYNGGNVKPNNPQGSGQSQSSSNQSSGNNASSNTVGGYPKSGTLTVSRGTWWVRSGTNTNTSAIGVVQTGQKYKYSDVWIDPSDHSVWRKISYGSKTGWIGPNAVASYATGGVNNFTGIANLHGKPNSVETIFNASDGKKLYEYIHNTDDLASRLIESMFRNSGKNIGVYGHGFNTTGQIQYVFNGNLSFPNMRDGDGISKFIKELSTIGTDAIQFSKKFR